MVYCKNPEHGVYAQELGHNMGLGHNEGSVMQPRVNSEDASCENIKDVLNINSNRLLPDWTCCSR